ncbi:Alpha/beta hydrolase family-domain-containing protein [Mycena amicta]|nr:Alpha/beta hydrolase family-domain-containing protein [Mycena amicta]
MPSLHSSLNVTPIVFDCPPTEHDPPGRVLKMTAKWYWTDESLSNEEGVSMLFAHCIGSHKEQWEPVIQTVFANQRGKARQQRVRESWVFDWQNHGQGAVVNRDMIANTRQMGVCTWAFFPIQSAAFEYAAALKAFVRSARMQGKHMVAIGHSAGAAAMLLAASDLPIPGTTYPYQSIVLVEPSLATPQMFYKHIAPLHPALIAATQMRRSKWSSREEAIAWFAKRRPWKAWDKRVVRIFVEHGLVQSDTPGGGVHLKCDPRQEALSFPDIEPHFAAMDEIGRVSRAVPMHLVWAGRSEIISKSVQDALSDESLGRVAASVTHVEGGHLVVQESPDLVARVICNALDAVGVRVDLALATRSRL